MLLPEPTAQGRMRFFLKAHHLTQQELATILGVTGARVSQLLNGPGLKTEHITELSAKFPTFSASYYLDGCHTISGMTQVEGDVFGELPHPYDMIYKAMLTYEERGWSTSTYLSVGEEVFKAMLAPRGEVYIQRGFIAHLQAALRIPSTRVSISL